MPPKLKAYEKLMPSFKSESTPINPYRVAYEINEFLTDNTIYIGDGGDVVTITATAVRAAQTRQLDGSGSARHARCGHFASRWPRSSSIRKRKFFATTATVRSV